MSPPQDSIAWEPPLAFKSQPAGARLNLNPLGRGQGGDYARFASLRSALHALLRPSLPTPGSVGSCLLVSRWGLRLPGNCRTSAVPAPSHGCVFANIGWQGGNARGGSGVI